MTAFLKKRFIKQAEIWTVYVVGQYCRQVVLMLCPDSGFNYTFTYTVAMEIDCLFKVKEITADKECKPKENLCKKFA